MKPYTKKGFTLLEILLVIALLAILFATVLYALNPSNIIAEVNDNKRKADALTLYQAIEQYALKTGSYPPDIQSIPADSSLEICKTGAPSCTGKVDLSVLVPSYVSSIPAYSSDPIDSGFYIVKDINNKVGVGGVKSVDNTMFVQGLTTQIVTPPATVEYLIVAGGGGGGAGAQAANNGGGGGAGGFRTGSLDVAVGAIPVTIGAGGTGGTETAIGTNGGNSQFSTIVAAGGGAGGGGQPGFSYFSLVGGSGGGGAFAAGVTNGAAGNTPSTSPAQGFSGGNGIFPIVNPFWAGGGGGAAQVGSSSNGTGGNGLSSSINGTAVLYAGGGAGGQDSGPSLGGAGGGGTGGRGIGPFPAANPTAGTNGLGGGGGGGSSQGGVGGKSGANGGSGIVIIRYKTDGSDGISPSSTGGTKTTSGAYTIHTFTSSGTFTVVES
jgi:prepilin-type N-terminal cleavage/methylation domain-containing protein